MHDQRSVCCSPSSSTYDRLKRPLTCLKMVVIVIMAHFHDVAKVALKRPTLNHIASLDRVLRMVFFSDKGKLETAQYEI